MTKLDTENACRIKLELQKALGETEQLKAKCPPNSPKYLALEGVEKRIKCCITALRDVDVKATNDAGKLHGLNIDVDTETFNG